MVDYISKYIVESKKLVERKINVVNNNFYGNGFKISIYNLNKLTNLFEKNFLDAQFVKTSNYLFSETLFSFADAMISSTYTLKMNRENTESESILNEIGKIDFESFHTFKVTLRTHHQKFLYLEFEPISQIIPSKLTSDYKSLTDTILAHYND